MFAIMYTQFLFAVFSKVNGSLLEGLFSWLRSYRKACVFLPSSLAVPSQFPLSALSLWPDILMFLKVLFYSQFILLPKAALINSNLYVLQFLSSEF